MPTARKTTAKSLLCILLVAMQALYGGIRADEQLTRRVSVGINVFPTLLAADSDIANKRSADGHLLLLLIHTDQFELASEMAKGLSAKGTIRGFPLAVKTLTLEQLPSFNGQPIAGIFVVQPLGDGVSKLVEFSHVNRTLTFSPFEGDVESGVLGGISVTDRVLPYVNLKAMNLVGVHIKPFFLRIAERYGKP